MIDLQIYARAMGAEFLGACHMFVEVAAWLAALVLKPLFDAVRFIRSRDAFSEVTFAQLAITVVCGAIEFIIVGFVARILWRRCRCRRRHKRGDVQ